MKVGTQKKTPIFGNIWFFIQRHKNSFQDATSILKNRLILSSALIVSQERKDVQALSTSMSVMRSCYHCYAVLHNCFVQPRTWFRISFTGGKWRGQLEFMMIGFCMQKKSFLPKGYLNQWVMPHNKLYSSYYNKGR